MNTLLPALITAFILGLSASTHCVVMCGGIATALSAKNKAKQKGAKLRLLSFHVGRIICYGFLGITAGVGVQISAQLLDQQTDFYHTLSAVLRLLAALLLLLTALYLANINHAIKHVEKIFSPIWKIISPHTIRFMAMNTSLDAIKLGFLWGFLPCGMIYTAIIWALSQQHSMWAGSLMLAFGLGTSPSLLLMQSFHLQVTKYLQQNMAKYLMAFILFIMSIGSSIPAIEYLIATDEVHHHEHH